MSNTQKNVYTNKSFNAEIIDPDYLEVFATEEPYAKISSVQNADHRNDKHVTPPSFPPRPAEIHGRHKFQISLWLLFLFIICSLVGIVVTGVVTFFITKDRFTDKQFAEIECKWTSWSPWTECSITCGRGVIIRVKQQLKNSERCNETFETKICSKETCPADALTFDMRFNRSASHPDVFIADDLTMLSNVYISGTTIIDGTGLKNYDGAIADTCIEDNDIVYYEVIFSYSIINTLQSYWLVLEIGLAEHNKVDNSFTVSNKNVSGWSFGIGHRKSHNQTFLWAEGPDLSIPLKVLSDNQKGTNVNGTFLVLLNRQKHHFSLIQNNRVLYTFQNVYSDKNLCPVFGIYNPWFVHAQLQILNPRNFTLLSLW
ncbi:THBS1 [Mytilus coruscus]|uniref:THBS1 n=1 Tax=Mytilus coruscus TaxID=42192 RepID=A0A6J8E4F8_MYTCO|nr:THBS1 [Mytilus coruscus]